MKQTIDSYLEKVKKKDLVSHIGECFFQPVQENGIVWQLRRTNLQRDNGRTLNIIDEIEQEERKERELREEEEAKDMTFEQFQERFLAHIEGTAANEREAIESADENAGDAQNKSIKQGSMSKRGTEANKTGSSHHVGDDQSVEQDRKS